MELIRLYSEMLRDPAIPSNRVVRKTAAIAVLCVLTLAYFRHVVIGFGFGEPVIVTLGLGFIFFTIVGIFGGITAGGFYASFLEKVGAQRSSPSVVVFFAECLFAATSPVFGLVIFGAISGRIG